MLEKIRREPAVVTGAVQAALGLLLAFGVDLNKVQVGAILAATAAALAFVVRSKVTPVARPRGEAGESVLVVCIFVAVVILVVLALFGGNGKL